MNSPQEKVFSNFLLRRLILEHRRNIIGHKWSKPTVQQLDDFISKYNHTNDLKNKLVTTFSKITGEEGGVLYPETDNFNVARFFVSFGYHVTIDDYGDYYMEIRWGLNTKAGINICGC